MKEAFDLLHVGHKVERQLAENCWKCGSMDVDMEDWELLIAARASAAVEDDRCSQQGSWDVGRAN